MSRNYVTLGEAWRDIIAFDDKRFKGWRDLVEVYWGNALAGEVGELCNLLKKRAHGGTKGDAPTKANVVEELADVFIYLVLTTERLGIAYPEFRDAVSAKMDRNEERVVARGGVVEVKP